MGRTASGVRGISISEDDEVVGMVCVQDFSNTIMVVSENGFGKRTLLNDPDSGEAIYRITNRGGKGVKTLTVTEKTGNLIAIKVVTDDDDLMIINKSGITIRMHVADIRTQGRATQGVKLINLKGKDQIAAVAKVEKDDEEIEELDNNNLDNNDSGVACQYKSGTGTNTLTFRGRLNTTANGFLSFTDGFIHLNGTATMQDVDGETIQGIRDETADDSILLDASAGASGTVNGAVSDSRTVVVDGVSGTIAVGQVVTVSGAGSTPAASITATSRNPNVTTVSTNNELTITAVASQTSFTVSEEITVANDINLLFSTDGGEKPELNAGSMTTEGADGATSVIGTQAYRTGFGVDTIVGRVLMLEDSDDKIINETDGTDGFAAEDFTTDAAGLIVVTQAGSASGSASVLNGVTTT
jgi:hypothetical protein